MGIYKTKSDQSKIGNYMAHIGKPGVLGLGPEEITVRYEQKQTGLTEPEEEGQEPEPIWADDESRPIKELTGYWLYEVDGDEIPTEQQVEVDYEEPGPTEDPLTDVEKLQQGIRTYREANEAAKEIIFTLMVKVAGALMAFELFTEDKVNAEGARFVAFHREPILDYKTAGRNAVSAQALYASVASDASKAAFPWLEGGTGPTFLGLFASELGVTP